MTRDWSPFVIAEPGAKPDSHRSISTPEGLGDRLRIAAFAEFQAREAFLWAAERFEDAPSELRAEWRFLAVEEQKHYSWILTRMGELGVEPGSRRVSAQLWASLAACPTARDFEIFIANAEERGRMGALHFHQHFQKTDPVTAEIFRKIAEEEITHVALAGKYFPDAPKPRA